MWLSRLILNPRSRQVQRDLADCHQMHRSLMSVWPDLPDGTPRQFLGLLYRLEPARPGQGLVVVVQTAQQPDWHLLPSGYLQRAAEAKDLSAAYAALRPGRVLRFRLRANPTRSVYQGDTVRGLRVDLRREPDKIDWLARHGERHGFELVGGAGALSVSPSEALTGRRGTGANGQRITLAASLFEGVLRIGQLEAFHDGLRHGIGRGKAFGCGLLSLAPGGDCEGPAYPSQGEG